jgi:hypothetical protein
MFEKILTKTISKLNKAKEKKLINQFALIGGLAVSKWSIPRATADLDFAISIQTGNCQQLAEYLGGKYRKGDITDPIAGVITYTEKDELGTIPIQLIIFPPSWEKVALENINFEKLDRSTIPIADWQALVLLKVYAGSPLDLQDAKNIIASVAPTSKQLEKLKAKASSLRVARKLEKVLKN